MDSIAVTPSGPTRARKPTFYTKAFKEPGSNIWSRREVNSAGKIQDTVNRYRLTVYFVLTALVSITVALLVVNQVIGGIAEENLTAVAEKIAVRDSIHLQAMLRGNGSGMQHTGMQMADMPTPEAMTPGMPGMHEVALPQDGPLTLEYLAGPQGLSGQYSDLVHGLDLVSLELLDLDHNSLWSTDPQIQLLSPAARSLAGKPLAGFCATRSRRIQDLYGMVVHVIRCNTHYAIDNRR